MPCSQKFIVGNDYITVPADCTRIPFGHPEGFIEAFANVYNSAMVAIKDEIAGNTRESRVMIFQIFGWNYRNGLH